jgi:hypothetical protein
VAQSFLWLPFSLVLRRTFDEVLPARDMRGLLLSVGALLFHANKRARRDEARETITPGGG